MRIFHKITVAYPVTTDSVGQQTFSFSSVDEARSFRVLAEREGFKVLLHTFDNLVSSTDAMSEIYKDIELTADQLAYEELYNG